MFIYHIMFISIFLTIKKYIYSFYTYIWSLFFSVVQIYGVKDNVKSNLYWQYILQNYLSLNQTNMSYDIIKAEIYKDGITRNIIWPCCTIEKVINEIDIVKFDVNETIMPTKIIILNIYLDSNKLQLKNLFDHYADSSKLHNHTIRTLLLLKDIKWNNNDNIIVEYLQMRKQIKKYSIGTVLDKHISELYI